MAKKSWIAIPEFPHYEVNQLGEVRSYKGYRGTIRKTPKKLTSYVRGGAKARSYGLYKEGVRHEVYQSTLKRGYFG